MRRTDPDFTRPKAILFDMDGTLTEPMLDFPKIKAEMGIGSRPILEALAEMDETRRLEAEAVLLRHEERAAAESTLNPGCRELLNLLSDLNITTALITRNSRLSVETVLARHRLPMTLLISRDDGTFKPDPYPLRLACQKLCVAESQAWMVGDGQYDVEAGRAAGVRTVWVSHGRERPFAAEPWRVAVDLHAVASLVRESVTTNGET